MGDGRKDFVAGFLEGGREGKGRGGGVGWDGMGK